MFTPDRHNVSTGCRAARRPLACLVVALATACGPEAEGPSGAADAGADAADHTPGDGLGIPVTPSDAGSTPRDAEPDPVVSATGEICGNNRDDDGDGWIDCRDAECEALRECVPEICDDGEDNDDDGHFDCGDEECYGELVCGLDIYSVGSFEPCTPRYVEAVAVYDLWEIEQLPEGGFVYVDSANARFPLVMWSMVTTERSVMSPWAASPQAGRVCNYADSELCPVWTGRGGTSYVFVASFGDCAELDRGEYEIVIENATAMPVLLVDDAAYLRTERCDDGEDNDLNGDTDCEDSSCAGRSGCP